ncbi:hypothetical protein HER10_EVM0002549 [Colletotrichum scovillei]|uniref:Uncharacterized protein n=1 Tax=Colletotrichum scovillei TaxID=1209932 RepID=A0A9P7UBM3_9PEZI|nr:uncharacterized protein HER10_EVM0002549 [Colletotrichum scovillei]KAF4774697.1 hypothetical protein HER10_EVM0002549 [Colletotrichum scovillei]KAG7039445.1 hypothetical protein JMJ78_0001195 [Colletotrichum scovillei]KAG7041622.1 hypothetical protein JMJ77_0012142 [Colletotrichum scovillei]KAG7061649.1 hypothetical protein JMJ76_0003609 [Colletotrichum scovillei]
MASTSLLSASIITNMAVLPAYGNYHHVQLAEVFDCALDQRLGRHLAPTPAHLTRVVYVPNHKDITTHLPLYDYNENYDKAVKEEPIGSSKYKLGLAMMRRPLGDGTDAQVRYLVNFQKGLEGVAATVERRMPSHNGEIVSLHIPADDNGNFRVAPHSMEQDLQLAVTSSFPVPDTKMHAAANPVRHPWFTISQTSRDGSITVPSNLEWQARPTEDGPLRYTLVDTEAESSGGEPAIHAIYHHVGIGFALPNDYSEGILLLSEDLNGEAEALAIATLLGVLRQTRSINQPPPRPRKKSLVKRVLGKI